MAANKIKGITIEFRGDTSSLDRALREVKSETRDVDKALREVNNALKFNPNNVELLAQKQTLLKQRVSQTKEQLELLRNAQKELDKDQSVDKTSLEYQKLQRDIITTESKLNHFIKEGKKVDQLLHPLTQAGNKLKNIGNKAEAAGQAMAPLSQTAAAVDVALGGLAYKSGVAADDLNTLSKVSGIGTEELQKYQLAANLVDVSVEAIVKSQTRMKKSMLSASEGTGSAAEAWNKLGVAITNSDGSLKSQDAVFQETIKALGEMSNETERDALAMQIFGKSATELNPLIEDSGETYKMVSDIFKSNDLEIVDQATLDKANQFNDEIDKIKATALLSLQTIGMNLAGSLVPIIEKVAAVAEKFFGWLSKLSPETLQIVGVIAAVVAGLSPLLIIGGKLITGIGMLLTVWPAISAAFAGLAGPVGIAIAAIAAAVAIGVALYKNWDKIKAAAGALKDFVVEKFTAMKNSVKAIFTAVKNAMVAPIIKARDIIKGIITKIKGFFSGLKFKWPKIKLPHFAVHPKGWQIGDLLKGSIPSLGIDWYKKGGIFNSPSIIGVGEAGSEAVLPIDRLQEMMMAMADSIVNGVAMANRMQAAGAGGDVVVTNYLYPSGPKMGETTVKMYDTYKKIMG